MEIELSTTDRVAVICVTGRIDAYTAPEVEEKLREVVDGQRNVVVDLGGTDYVSSAGLRVLITLAKRSMAEKFEMRLSGLQEAVREVFEIAGFTRLFEIRDTKEDALESLSA